VYRHVFSTAVTDSIHDFSLDGGSVASAAAWAANRLLVTVDGSIWRIDLTSGLYVTVLQATPTVAYGRAAPSSDASRFVVETQSAPASLDLWLHALP